MAYTKYSLTPANNTAAPPDGAPEGMLPSAVNDTMRDMMAQIRDCGDGIRDGTYTMTAPKITGGTITGSTINNSAIGGTTAAAGAFTTLSATGVTTVQAGTVSLPAITTTGDTNTGIFFPAADTIAFTEGGVESMRINSSGNVGIGLTAPTRLLHIDGGSSATYFQMTNTASGRTNADGFQIAQDGANAELINREAGYLNFATSNTERMRIDSSGNVGIGTSSPAFASGTGLEVQRTGDATVRIERTDATASAAEFVASSGLVKIGATSGSPFAFITDNTERMRVNAGAPILCLAGGNTSATGTGIAFPATQSASSDANTLDDYEEGTWTPTVFGSTTAGTYTITANNSRYRKIGSQVTVWGDVQFSAATGGAGNVRISNLPFNYVSGTGAIPGVLFMDTVNTTSASSIGSVVAATSGASSNEIFPFLLIDNAPGEQIPISGVSTSSRFAFTYIYTA